MEYNEIINEYKSFSTEEKRKLLSDEVAELVLIIKKLKEDTNLSDEDPNNDILKKLYSSDSSEDEYLVGMYENILKLKEDLGGYLTLVVENIYE